MASLLSLVCTIKHHIEYVYTLISVYHVHVCVCVCVCWNDERAGGLWDVAWNALAPYRPKKAISKVAEVCSLSEFHMQSWRGGVE